MDEEGRLLGGNRCRGAMARCPARPYHRVELLSSPRAVEYAYSLGTTIVTWGVLAETELNWN